MKKITLLFLLFSQFSAFSQIISPNGDNIFYYNGAADVTFRYLPRGAGGRAFVHDDRNILTLNFEGDFSGGTKIGREVFFKDGGNSYIYSGNFGIGTSMPSQRLDVNGNINMAGGMGRRLFMGGVGGSTFGLAYDSSYPNYGIFYTEGEPDFVSISPNGNATNGVMNILGNGNVGIGTVNPTESLEVYKSDNLPGVISLKSSRNDFGYVDVGRISAKQATTEVSRIGLPRAGGTNTGFITFWTKADNSEELTEKVRFSPNGNVGIGTTSPAHKLDVIGTIRSREVKVDMNGADFVFEEKYPLMPLSDLETFIKKNKHLPEIAPAKEMQEQGANLGDLNTKLLQKIEELTLYTIEQNKNLELQNKKLQLQNEKINRLEQKLTTLEAKTINSNK